MAEDKNELDSLSQSHTSPTAGPTAQKHSSPKLDVVLSFLEALQPGGPWLLTAILPDRNGAEWKTVTNTAFTHRDVIGFVRRHNGRRGLYYSVNPARTPMRRKAAKTDIGRIEYALADCDPRDDETPEAAKARYLEALDSKSVPRPSFIVDSGNGLQLLWRLEKPIALPPPIESEKVDKNGKASVRRQLTPEAEAIIDDVEARVAHGMITLGTVAGTQNIDRILRLPGTTNLPNAAKRKRGRVERETKLVETNDVTYPLSAFPLPPPVEKPPQKMKSSIRPRGEGEARSASRRTIRAGGFDLAALNAAAVPYIEPILHRIVPYGFVEGNEFIVLNPRRDDTNPGSFKINLSTGKWADFACDARGGDLIGYVAYVLNITLAAAARVIKQIIRYDDRLGAGHV